ncbi:MAG: pseudouridine synthase [Candidatus Shikimatogenerans bostrichidophilus]|nr:MAG: pseudouridine synthase [Candidatus Shikimatogenerans bostrichidophilus]
MLNNKIRLNKYISYSGICSRRKADNLIKLGLINVNGKNIRILGYKVNYKDKIIYNNKILKFNKFIYIILNKPKNCITTTKDNYYRNTILNYIPVKYIKEYRVYPVGRLDKNTTGVLLLTNNGILCNKLLHPKNKIKKTYKIILNKKIKSNHIIKLKKGLKFKEGKIYINNIKIIKNKKNILILSIYIGWNRIIHRIFKTIGYKVVYLQRINFGGLKLKKYKIFKEGSYKIIKYKELKKIINKNEKNNYNKWT